MIQLLMSQMLLLLIAVKAILGQAPQAGGTNIGGTGGWFDTFLNGSPGSPTAAPYADPFANAFGSSMMGGMFPFMAADIDFADQMSARADARAARLEVLQARRESATASKQGQKGSGGRPGQQGQSIPKQGMPPVRHPSSRYPQNWQSPVIRDQYRQNVNAETSRSPFTGTTQSENRSQSKQGQSKFTFQHKTTDLKRPKTTPISKRSTSDSRQQDINKQRLSQILSSSGNQVFKDSAKNTASNVDIPFSSRNNNRQFKQRSQRPRINQRRPMRRSQIDPDLMSDMMDMAGDLGMSSMFMNNMSRRSGRCDMTSVRTLMEYMLTGRMCGVSTNGMRFGLGRR